MRVTAVASWERSVEWSEEKREVRVPSTVPPQTTLWRKRMKGHTYILNYSQTVMTTCIFTILTHLQIRGNEYYASVLCEECS